MTSQICFPTADPVTGDPVLDGFLGHDIEDEDGVFASNPDETGYTLGAKVTLADAALAGVPPAVVIETVKERSADFIHLGFYVRYAATFDQNNVIVLSMRPWASNGHDSSTRRFDIYPVWDEATYGAEDPDPNNSSLPASPGGTPPTAANPVKAGYDDAYPARPGQANASSFWKVRTKRQPQHVDYWTGATPTGDPTPWTYVGDINLLPDGVEIKVRSSQPEPNASPKVCAWSLEVKLPLAAGNDWIDLTGHFHLFLDVVRIQNLSGGSDPLVHGHYNTQYIWPNQANRLHGNPKSAPFLIDPTWYGDAIVPAAGQNPCSGVQFVNGSMYSVGVRDKNDAAWSAPGENLRGPNAPAGTTNRLVAQVENTVAAGTAAGVSAKFFFAQWGINGPAGSLDWADAEHQAAAGFGAGHDAVQVNQNQPVTNGTPVELTDDWEAAKVPLAYSQSNGGDHCTMVVLDGAPGVVFSQGSIRRNIIFGSMSKFERDVTVSDVGNPPPPGGAAYQQFVLFTTVRSLHESVPKGGVQIDPKRGYDGPLEDVIVGWQQIVHGFIDTSEDLTINGTTYRSLSPTSSFGYMLSHQGKGDRFTHQLELAPGNDPIASLSTRDHTAYAVRVPAGGHVQLRHVLEAKPVPWWLRLWLLLVWLWHRIFG